MSKYTLNISPVVTSGSNLTSKLYKNHSNYHVGDSGLDLFCISDQEIPSGLSNIIKLGIRCSMIKEKEYDDNIIRIPNKKIITPQSYMLVPRSSMGKNTPLRLSNSVGIIDAGYTGEIMAIVDNHSDTSYNIKRGDRLFQIVRGDLKPFTFLLVDELELLPSLVIASTTELPSRENGGFGSTDTL